MRQTEGKRLDQAGEVPGVTGIAQPGECIRDGVKQNRTGKRRGQKRFPRSAIRQGPAQQAHHDQGKIAARDQRIEHGRAVVNVQDDIGNKKGNERNSEFVTGREVSRAAEGDGRHGREVRQPGGARSDGEAGDNPIGDRRHDKKKSGNHSGIIFNLPERYAIFFLIVRASARNRP